MREIILIGSGGCMREIVWQMQEQNKESRFKAANMSDEVKLSGQGQESVGEYQRWQIRGYVDCQPPTEGSAVIVGGEKIPYLGDDDILLDTRTDTDVAVCTGNPILRKKIAMKLKQNPFLHFPNIILGDTRICEDIVMGEGCIISMDTRISTNVRLGDFVFINLGSRICHDGELGDFVTLSPDVKLAGAVKVGAESDIGIGSNIIQGISIGRNVIAGAGCVIVNDIEDNCTIVGVPAKPIRKANLG